MSYSLCESDRGALEPMTTVIVEGKEWLSWQLSESATMFAISSRIYVVWRCMSYGSHRSTRLGCARPRSWQVPRFHQQVQGSPHHGSLLDQVTEDLCCAALLGKREILRNEKGNGNDTGKPIAMYELSPRS